MVMQTTTIWVLTQTKLDEDDLLWCKGLGVEIAVENLFNTVHYNGGSKKYCTGQHIELTTHCAKQETMLKLKYGDKLIEKFVVKSISIPYES